MNIWHFLGSLNPKFGGPTASVPIQCIGVSKLGADVALVTYPESRPYEQKLIDAGVQIVEYPRPSGFFSKLTRSTLRDLLRKNDDADIYHYHGVWMPGCHFISSAARRKGKKYVINPRGDLEIYRINYNKWKKAKKMLAWYLYGKKDTQNASCIIATSEQEAEAVRELGITAPIAIIPNGLDLSGFPEIIIHANKDKKVLLFLSRVNPIKGLELLIDAWKQLPKSFQDEWELHIAGNSDPADYIHTLENKVRLLNLESNVKFVGPITGEAKMKKYMDSDLFVLPTFNENFGNVIAEAMMCGCPAITTKNAPWSCLVEDQCGWWIDLSVENLKRTLVESMSLSTEQRHEMGLKGRQCIINRFSCENVAKHTYELYEWVLGKKEKPSFVFTV